jgi:hypothetical protein
VVKATFDALLGLRQAEDALKLRGVAGRTPAAAPAPAAPAAPAGETAAPETAEAGA